jgi:hypothetical protein
LAKWLSEYDIKTAKHPELITRCTGILKFLAQNGKLEDDTIELLWDTCIHDSRHEAVSEATLQVITELGLSLPADILMEFLKRIRELPQEIADKIILFKDFFINCLCNLRRVYGK